MYYSIQSSSITISFTNIFEKWLNSLKNQQTKVMILQHLDRMMENNFGKTRYLGEGVFEKKIDYGNGYRLYYFCRRHTQIVLLTGGSKTTQRRDIKKAKQIKKAIDENKIN